MSYFSPCLSSLPSGMRKYYGGMADRLLIICVLSFSLLSCAGETVELKNAVTAYNKMLTEALAKPDENIMEYFTSNNELSRIGAYILRLETEKKLMVSELLELQFLSTSTSEEGKTATVNTSERWTYHYVDNKTREKITEEEAIAYENTYHLLKESGHWVVDRIDVTEK